uniref:Protein lin-52 homolog n=1 Tax=Equus asinus TaxID=9793 RepID=A0A9L0KC44_EQUAS
MGWKMASPTDGTDLEASLLSFEKLDRASPDLWPEQLPGVAEFAASFKSPITSSPPKWMAEIERDDIDMLKARPSPSSQEVGRDFSGESDQPKKSQGTDTESLQLNNLVILQ